MKHREATPRDIKHFERIAAEPKTAEVMESLGQQLFTNFERPSRVFLEVAANKLGLPYDVMGAFHEWFRFDRVAQPTHGKGGPPLPQSPAGA
jgi:hypothetical protein